MTDYVHSEKIMFMLNQTGHRTGASHLPRGLELFSYTVIHLKLENLPPNPSLMTMQSHNGCERWMCHFQCIYLFLELQTILMFNTYTANQDVQYSEVVLYAAGDGVCNLFKLHYTILILNPSLPLTTQLVGKCSNEVAGKQCMSSLVSYSLYTGSMLVSRIAVVQILWLQ